MMIASEAVSIGHRAASSRAGEGRRPRCGPSRSAPDAGACAQEASRACRRPAAPRSVRDLVGVARGGDVACRRPQISRATGVSSSTGGTPAASASSGVSPKPSYSDRNANTDARA